MSPDSSFMTMQVFGNSPLPVVATHCLRKPAEHGESEHGSDAKQFFRNFYVDDRLASVAREDEAIDLLQQTKALLAESNLRLHKLLLSQSKARHW